MPTLFDISADGDILMWNSFSNMHVNNSTSNSGSASVSDRHLLFIDGLRGLAALFVTIHHMWLQLWPQAHHMLPAGLMRFSTGWLGYGHFGVTVFIVLSGFSLACSAAQRDSLTQVNKKSFCLRRALRILPPYYLALLVSCVLVATLVGKPTGTHWDVSLPITTPGLFSHVFMMQDMFYISQINHTFWSIALEWKLYFLFPFLLIACSRIGPLATAAACTAFGYAALFLLHGTPYNNFPIHFVGLFAMGTAGALLVFSRRSDWRKLCQSRAVTWIAVASVILVAGASWAYYLRGLFYTDLFVALATVAGLIEISLGRWPLLRAALECKPLAFIGTFAYSLYLIHAPLIQCVWQYVVHPMGVSRNAEFFLLILIGTPLILTCAFLFFLACERPFIRSRRSEGVKARPSDRPAVSCAQEETGMANSSTEVLAELGRATGLALPGVSVPLNSI
jgi:peptidoglycan/LPS O-acetylase OafA/YrhL